MISTFRCLVIAVIALLAIPFVLFRKRTRGKRTRYIAWLGLLACGGQKIAVAILKALAQFIPLIAAAAAASLGAEGTSAYEKSNAGRVLQACRKY